MGSAALSRFNAASTARAGSPAPPSTPETWDRNLVAAADALVPRGRPPGALGPDDPGDPNEPGALDVSPVRGTPNLPFPLPLDDSSANGCVQVMKGIFLLEQEFVKERHGQADLWDPQSVSRRLSDLLDREAAALGAARYSDLGLADRQGLLRRFSSAAPGTVEREAFLILFNFLTIGFYSGFPGMIDRNDPRHGWRVVAYPGHFAPPFGKGTGSAHAELTLIRRRKRELAARGVSTAELDELERLVAADWAHFAKVEGGWRL